MTTEWFTKERFSDWKKLYEFLETDALKDRWVFRGQACASWGLKSTIEILRERFCTEWSDLPAYEQKLIREFRRRAHIYHPDVPGEDDEIEWLALLRHHGGPTRFLDFTYSSLVATHFALEESDQDAAVWAIEIEWFHKRAGDILAQRKNDGAKFFCDFSFKRDGESFRQLFWHEPRCRFIASVEPMRLNERLTLQQGLFVCQGDITRSFEENVGAEDEAKHHVRKIIIEKTCRKDALAHLRKMNIERTTLFPGLDGFARSLNMRFEQIGKLRGS